MNMRLPCQCPPVKARTDFVLTRRAYKLGRMKVLLIGNGGREHALAWRLASSSRVTALFAAPGNPGTAQVADNVDIKVSDPAAVIRFVKVNAVDLVVIGPENPLAEGLADKLLAEGNPVKIS